MKREDEIYLQAVESICNGESPITVQHRLKASLEFESLNLDNSELANEIHSFLTMEPIFLDITRLILTDPTLEKACAGGTFTEMLSRLNDLKREEVEQLSQCSDHLFEATKSSLIMFISSLERIAKS